MTRTTTVRQSSLPARFLLGDDLRGGRRTDATFWRSDVTSVTESRWACLPGWQRSLARLGAGIGGVTLIPAAITEPALFANSAGAIGTVLAGKTVHTIGGNIRHARFRRTYIQPLRQAITSGPKGVPVVKVHVSRDMAGLAARMAGPMTPAERKARDLYGQHVQPVVRWLPEHAMRAYWWTRDATEPIRKPLDWFRIPTETLPPRVEISVRNFVTKDQRDLIRQAVLAKLGVGDLVETWDQVGPTVRGTWVVRERPPGSVSLADLIPHMTGLAEHEFCVGLTTGGRPVVISLDDDAPHIACSAGSGAGKSVLAKLLGMQVLAKGGRVVILDRKGSHRWARNLAGVTYCTKPATMHATLLELSAQADQRNEQALEEEEGWDPGQRVFVIFEEMNATVSQLRSWWERTREKSDPKPSPAVEAFRNIMFMGRSAKMNLFGVAQMLTANVTGGPEARENFGVRALARYSANNWKMLVPECPMPRKSKTRGRWQFAIAGEAIEVQVGFSTDRELWDYLNAVPVSPQSSNHAGQEERMGTPPVEDIVTLEAARARFCPDVPAETLKKRRSRARAKGQGPRIAKTQGRAELYDADEFLRWLTAESLTSEETTK